MDFHLFIFVFAKFTLRKRGFEVLKHFEHELLIALHLSPPFCVQDKMAFQVFAVNRVRKKNRFSP